MEYSDKLLRDVFERVKTIACVGASMNPLRASHYVSCYLTSKGYTVYPINPGHIGESLFGQSVAGDLATLPGPVDMIDIFRRSEHVADVVDEALAQFPGLSVVWMQIGVSHPEAAARAKARGVTVIQDRCPKIEFQRLYGESHRAGPSPE